MCYTRGMTENNNITTYFDFLGQSIGAEFYLVGGAVRDRILGLPVKDYDFIARGIQLDDLLKGLAPHGPAEEIGDRFPVVMFQPTLLGGRYEIALPRTEVNIGKGTKGFRAEVRPDLGIEEDLKRRDFTINSMAYDVHSKVMLDPYNARKDLQDGVIRILHPDSFTDDPLRILRMLRFVAKLGFVPSEKTKIAAYEARELLADREEVPGERIKDELLKVVVEPNADNAFRLARDLDLLRHFLPELADAVGVEQNHYHAFTVDEHLFNVLRHTDTKDAEVKLAALLHDIGKPKVKWVGLDGVPHFYWNKSSGDVPAKPYAPDGLPQVAGAHEEVGAEMTEEILTRLRFSADQVDRVAGLVREHMFVRHPKASRASARRLLQRLSALPGTLEDNVTALFALRYGDTRGGKVFDDESIEAGSLDEALEIDRRFESIVREELAKDNALSTKDLTIGGRELMDLGFEGPEIGVVQEILLELVLDDPRLNSPDVLLDVTKKLPKVGIDIAVEKYLREREEQKALRQEQAIERQRQREST